MENGFRKIEKSIARSLKRGGCLCEIMVLGMAQVAEIILLLGMGLMAEP
jgi:hypothetical protein